MAPFFSATSSSSATSTRLTHLHVPDKSSRKKKRNLPSFSPWAQRNRRLKLSGSENGKSNKVDRGLNDPSRQRTPSNGGKGSLRMPWRTKGHRKSMTLEDPGSGAARLAMDSDEGTVRKSGKLDGPDSSGEGNLRGLVSGARLGEPSGRKEDGNNIRGQYLGVPTGDGQTGPGGLAIKPTRKEHMRTVSREDYLTARGANPRTGLVSPSITSSSRPSGEQARQDGKRTPYPVQKWRLKGDQWISMDTNDKTPMPSPPGDVTQPHVPSAQDRAQAYMDLLSESGVPLSRMEDRFIVNMPSAKDPNPPTMTTQQISDFQRAVERLRRHGGELVDPDTPPTPRPITPEGRSTPPNTLSKRKHLRFLRRGPPRSRGHQKNEPQLKGTRGEEHVHFAQLPEKKDHHDSGGEKGRNPQRHFSRDNAAKEHFLGEREAGGKHQIPLFQSLNAFLSQSPPWTKGMPTLEETEEVPTGKPVINSPEMQEESHSSPKGRIRGSLLERRTQTNVQKLPVDIPMRIPIIDQPSKECASTTITSITATPSPATAAPATLFQQHLNPVPPVKAGHAVENRLTGFPKSRDCIYPSSFQHSREGLDKLPIVGGLVVDVKGAVGERSCVRRGTLPDAGTPESIGDRTGFIGIPMIQRRSIGLPRRFRSIGQKPVADDLRALDKAALPSCPRKGPGGGSFEVRGIGSNTGPCEPSGEGNATDSMTQRSDSIDRCASSEHSDQQPTFGHLSSLAHQILLTSLILFLKLATYLCDMCRVQLHSDTARAGGRARKVCEDSPPRHANRYDQHVQSPGWLSAVFGAVLCAGMLILAVKGVGYFANVGLWAIWVMKMGT